MIINMEQKNINKYITAPNSLKREDSQLQHLRQRVLKHQQYFKKVHRLSEENLCDIFMGYKGLKESNIDWGKIIDQGIDELRLIKGNERVYFGEMKEKKRQGQGLMIDEKGRIYEGNWHDHERNGHGVEIYSNGNVYVGEFGNNKKHGVGVFYWFTLSPTLNKEAKYYEYYNGKWWGGLPDGPGCHKKSNGDHYEGVFKNGLKHGQGEENFFNGDIYKGEYVNGLPEGYGVYFWADRSRYEGDFKQGMRNGQGCWVSPDELESYKGPYKLDKKCGYGVYQWDDGYMYKGNFDNDVRHGFGELYEGNILKYRGQWIDGKMVVKNSHRAESVRNSLPQRLPTLSKLKPPSSAIVSRLRANNFSPKSQNSAARSRSPKSVCSVTKNRTQKNKTIKTEPKESFSKKKIVKRKPLSLEKKLKYPYPEKNKVHTLARKCTKKTCGCNTSIPISFACQTRFSKRSNSNFQKGFQL